MKTISAVIVIDEPTKDMRFLGVNVVERAALTAAKVGIRHIHLVGHRPPDEDMLRRLRQRGLTVSHAELKYGIFATAPVSDEYVVMCSDLVLEPRALKAMMALDATAPSRTLFKRRLRVHSDVRKLERAYLTTTNGGDTESVFTRAIRTCSVPLSERLVRLPITANQVTLAGFGLSLLAGWSFAFGSYWWGVAGALLYYASMILDCSDGEVARAKLADSRFGAWLETATDYLSYFAVMGGIIRGDVLLEGFCHHARAAIVAVPATLAIVALVGYQRAQVASANPGAFDDALAAQLGRGSAVQRFSVWGRQLIKRSFLAHLILFQAVIGFLPALLEIWAMGAVGALALVLAIHTHLVNHVRVEPLMDRGQTPVTMRLNTLSTGV
jgi:phosphatidylglycerophosphate synthase